MTIDILTRLSNQTPVRIVLSVFIFSLLPAFLLLAIAASVLLGPDDVTLSQATPNYASTSIDPTGYENLNFSFDYDAETFDSGDSFVYGWNDGSDHNLGTFLGLNEVGTTTPTDEIGFVSVSLPVAAEAAPFTVYIKAVVNSGSDTVVITSILVEGSDIPVCAPQYNVAGPTDIQNTSTGEYFTTVNDAIDDCDTVDTNTVSLLGDISTSEQITISKEITLQGNGHTISPTFAKTTNDNNSVIGVISSDSVSILNAVINGTGGTNLHGINTYVAGNVVIDTVTINNINRTGIVVNGSSVTVRDLTTTGSGWSAIDVDQGDGVADPSDLTIESTSVHGETSPFPNPQILVDDIAKDVSVTDVDSQYDYQDFPGEGATARIYTLKQHYPITGIKWNDANKNGIYDEGESKLSDWTITASNGEETVSTTTDVSGNYTLSVTSGTWVVTEEQQIGWEQSFPGEEEKSSCVFEFGEVATFTFISEEVVDTCDFGNYELPVSLACNLSVSDNSVAAGSEVTLSWEVSGATSASIDNGVGSIGNSGTETVTLDSENVTYTLTATNGEEIITCTKTVDINTSSGSSGSGNNTGSSNPTPQVLGATTDAPSCGPFLLQYMKKGQVNSPFEVTKLQIFLTNRGLYTPMTSVFDAATDASVRLFQSQHADQVLKPWFDLGLAPNMNPTGFVYKTTLWKINDMVCPGSTPFPTLP